MLKKNRGPRQVVFDGMGGLGLGGAVGTLLSLWGIFINARSSGGVEEAYGISIVELCFVYLGGGAVAGFLGGLLRPYLASLWGQALLCFVVTLSLYTAASLAMPGDIYGSPLLDGLLIACVATPIWLLVVRISRPTQRDLHLAAGVDPPAPRAPQRRAEPEYELWRDTPDGRELRLGSFVSRRAAEGKLESLSHLPHRYWIVQRIAVPKTVVDAKTSSDDNVSV